MLLVCIRIISNTIYYRSLVHILEAALLVGRSHILVAHSWVCGRKVLEHDNLVLMTRDDSNDDEYVLVPFFGTLVF